MSLWGVFLSALKAMPVRSIGTDVRISNTGYRRVRDVAALIDAICDAYDRRDFKPTADGTTYCNLAVSAIAEAMGCRQLSHKTANEIVAFIESSDDWSDVPLARAQDMASQGSLLVAGLTAEEVGQAHGHVVIIRPGKPCQSGKWGATPRCLNIGASNFIARAPSGPLVMMPVGLNEAFVPLPKIWVWRPSL